MLIFSFQITNPFLHNYQIILNAAAISFFTLKYFKDEDFINM